MFCFGPHLEQQQRQRQRITIVKAGGGSSCIIGVTKVRCAGEEKSASTSQWFGKTITWHCNIRFPGQSTNNAIANVNKRRQTFEILVNILFV